MKTENVVEHFGCITWAAQEIGVTRPTIYSWLRKGSPPLHWQAYIEKKTKGKLKAAPDSVA